MPPSSCFVCGAQEPPTSIDESYVVLSDQQPFLSESYFALPARRDMGVGSSWLGSSVAQLSHMGLGDEVRRAAKLALHAGPRSAATDVKAEPTSCRHCFAGVLESIAADCARIDNHAAACQDLLGCLEEVSNRPRNNRTEFRGALGAKSSSSTASGAALEPLQAAYDALREERRVVRAELDALVSQERALGAQSGAIWERLSGADLAALAAEDEAGSVLAAASYGAACSNSLVRAVPMLDLYPLGVRDGLPTVGGYRLSHTATDRLQWPEIAAAWGSAIALVRSAATAFRYRSGRFFAVALGADSCLIEEVARRQKENNAGQSSHCVKHIFRADGGAFSRSGIEASISAFLAWSSEVFEHATVANAAPSRGSSKGGELRIAPPHRQSRDGLGDVRLDELRKSEGWRKLLWLLQENLRWLAGSV